MPNVSTSHVKLFLHALDQVIGLQLISCREGVRFDAEEKRARLYSVAHAHLGEDKEPTKLVIDAVDSIYPRDARILLERFAERTKHVSDGNEALVVIANSLSGSAQELLRDRNINFYDEASGTLYFRHGQRHIDIRRTSKEPVEQRKIRSIFSGAREQVVHALLEHWRDKSDEGWLSGTELAAMAGTSPFTVSTTMQELERQDWVEATGSGPTLRRRLSRPNQLLDAWAQAWKQRLPQEERSRWYAYAGGSGGIVDHMLERLSEYHGWLMTGAAAANAVVPHLTSIDRVTIIVPPGVSEKWAADLKLEQAEKGSNVTFIERTGASLMFSDRQDSRFASRFVMYLDLLDGAGRNKELAAEFRYRELKLGEMVNG